VSSNNGKNGVKAAEPRRVERGGWTWTVGDPALLEPWADDIRAAESARLVKSNYERDVFEVESSSGARLFLKISKPSSGLRKLKERLAPRMKSEFDSLQLLRLSGVPAVEPLAWGKKDAESALATRAFENAETAGKLWFANAAENADFKKSFLADFAAFLRKLIDAGVRHPDLHHGNILARNENGNFDFRLVDAYGVEIPSKRKKNDVETILLVLGSFRGELSDAEAAEAIVEASGSTGDDAKKLWRRIFEIEARRAEALFKKRVDRIIAGERGIREYPDGTVILLNPAGDPLIEPDAIPAEVAEGRISLEKLHAPVAMELFRDSIRKRHHRLPVRSAIGWRPTDTPLLELIVEKSPPSPLSETELATRKAIAASVGCSFLGE